MARFKPALNSKGLRPKDAATIAAENSFKPALNSKGLRHNERLKGVTLALLQASPEFKGIKTMDFPRIRNFRLQASPEFKGIKTKLWRIKASSSASSQP